MLELIYEIHHNLRCRQDKNAIIVNHLCMCQMLLRLAHQQCPISKDNHRLVSEKANRVSLVTRVFYRCVVLFVHDLANGPNQTLIRSVKNKQRLVQCTNILRVRIEVHLELIVHPADCQNHSALRPLAIVCNLENLHSIVFLSDCEQQRALLQEHKTDNIARLNVDIL